MNKNKSKQLEDYTKRLDEEQREYAKKWVKSSGVSFGMSEELAEKLRTVESNAKDAEQFENDNNAYLAFTAFVSAVGKIEPGSAERLGGRVDNSTLVELYRQLISQMVVYPASAPLTNEEIRGRLNKPPLSAADTPTESDSDALADIIWFIKGARQTDSSFPLLDSHAESLRKFRAQFMSKS